MDIKPSPAAGQNAAVSASQDPATTLQQLPRATPLTAIVQSSVASAQQQAQQGRANLFDTLLDINGQKIQTQSNQAFTTGQRLKVEVTGNAAIKILQLINTAGNETLNQPLQQIQQGLRQSLPIQQSSALLLNNLVPLFKLLSSNQHSSAKSQIRAILASIPSLKQLGDARILKQNLAHSGNFLESSIKQLQALASQQAANPSRTAQSSAQSTHNAAPTGQANKISQEQLIAALRDNQQLGKQLDKLAGQDLKAQLLKLASELAPLAARTAANHQAAVSTPAEAALIQRILQALPHAQTSPSATQSQATLTLSNLPIDTQLQQLLHNPGQFIAPQQAAAHGNTATAKQTMDLAVSTVLRQLAATLARVQSNQLQSLAAPRSDADGATLINSWNIEIPAFLEGQFKPIQLQIREERQSETVQPENSQQRQWKITLGFEFEELGEFFATLRIIDNSVSATFWSEQADTLQRISSELQYLNKSLHKLGLNVEELECRRGKPALQQTRLDQQLVDIKT